ncbi:MAG: hypothetical protein J5933_04000, partial [Clostridia bacterium]|nr:hypothetical protein [Clostridia bacterium]
MKGKILFIVITILIVAFSGYLLRVAFVGDPFEDISQVNDLRLTQEGLDVVANWSEMDCDGYEVKVFHDGRLTVIPNVRDNTYTVKGVYPGERCVVRVTALLKNGWISRSAKEVLKAEKIKQIITLGDTSYYGFEGGDFNLKASAYGDLHYKSEDRSIAKVDKTGNVTLKKDGETFIVITADGNGLFEDGEREVSVLVYPAVLDKIKWAKAEDISPSRTVIRWKANEYAGAYTVLRKNPASGKYETYAENPAEMNYLEVTRDDYDYEIKATAEVDGEKVDGKVSDPIQVRGTTEESPSYSKFKIIGKIEKSDLDVAAEIHGAPKARTPQSVFSIGDEHIVSYVNMKNTEFKMVSYSKFDGSELHVT